MQALFLNTGEWLSKEEKVAEAELLLNEVNQNDCLKSPDMANSKCEYVCAHAHSHSSLTQVYLLCMWTQDFFGILPFLVIIVI